MVRNTDFRIFTAYSDPEAKELGTIYQAMNWTYLGQTSGTAKQYLTQPNQIKVGLVIETFARSQNIKCAENIGRQRPMEKLDEKVFTQLGYHSS